MIRVGVVDDHPVVAEGLAASLRSEPGVEVVWTAASVYEARALIDSDPPDVVLVDVRLRDGSGLELLPRAPAADPAFILISSFDRPQYARVGFERGARGFVLKTAPVAEIVAAIRSAASGGTAFEARHLALMSAGTQPSPRELEVIRLVSRGRSNDEIAAELGVARKTVEAYLTRLFERWRVTTRTELALHAEREGWLDPF